MTSFERVLRRYGTPAVIFADSQTVAGTAMALVQPVLDKHRQETASPLGWLRQERWLYLGEPEVALEVGENGFVRVGAREFTVFSARKVDLGKQSCHWWGILVPREEEA